MSAKLCTKSKKQNKLLIHRVGNENILDLQASSLFRNVIFHKDFCNNEKQNQDELMFI